MQLKSRIPFLTILFHLLFFTFITNARTFQENPLTKAIQLFDKEKFDEAEQLFKKLLTERPDDFMVNYFYGACRTENGHYSDEDLGYLLKASKEVNPLNIDYYLGVQYHAKSQWEKASAYYRLYKTVSSANEQEKAGLALKMEQCSNQINPFLSVETVATKDNTEITGIAAVDAKPESLSKAPAEEDRTLQPIAVIDSANAELDEDTGLQAEEDEIISETDSTYGDSAVVQRQDELITAEPVNSLMNEEQITFNVNSEITYLILSNFKTKEGEAFFKDGNEKQAELEKITVRTEILRQKYKDSKSRTEKDSIGQLILTLEDQAYDLRKDVTQLFLQSKNAENEYWQNASIAEKDSFIEELNSLSSQLENAVTAETEVIVDSPVLIMPPVLTGNEEIRTAAPKENPSGIIYKIQLGAYSRGIPGTLKPVFSKISILRKVENYTDENGVVVYTTGNLTNYEDAVVMQKQVIQEGIKDPKIAAYLNGKRITLEQAKELDKNR